MSTTTDLDPADYPLTPLDVMPLHPGGHLRHGEWYACERPGPDQPIRSAARFDWRCAACVTITRAEVDEHGDWLASWQYGPDDHPRQVAMSWMLARADHWASA